MAAEAIAANIPLINFDGLDKKGGGNYGGGGGDGGGMPAPGCGGMPAPGGGGMPAPGIGFAAAPPAPFNYPPVSEFTSCWNINHMYNDILYMYSRLVIIIYFYSITAKSFCSSKYASYATGSSKWTLSSR